MSKPKVAYVVSHPIQYVSPLLMEMAFNIDLEVCYFSDASIKGGLDKGFGKAVKWDIPLLEGYKYSFIKNYSKRKTPSNKFFDLINPGIIKYLFNTKAKIIIVSGWSYFSYLLTIIIGFLLGKKIWIRAENPLNQEIIKSKKVLLVKKIFLKYGLFKLADKFLFIGSQNKSFFKFYGVKESQLISTPYSVNNDFFNNECRLLKDKTPGLKNELKIGPDKKIVLFCGKYIEQKRPIDLLTAFSKLDNSGLILIFVGEGALRQEMEHYININLLNGKVILTGFVNQSEISKYYAIADVFVMCSGLGETWGLSVNEAMCFDLPVIVSNTCGCSYDLVKEGVNGFTYPEGDTDTLAEKIAYILSVTDFAKNAGLNSKEIISNFTIENTAKNINEAAVNSYSNI